MNKKLILTSMLAIAVAGPALAETFPNDGVMQENKTYENAATYTNMGVYSGTATAEPQYDINSYDITAGQYLAANGIAGTTCPANSYCIGGTFTFNETNTQGLASCPATYSLSAAGAKTEAECYRQCTSSDVAHSKSTGTFTGMFYSNNTNACEPVNDASCADGYHYKAGSAGLNVDASIGGVAYGYQNDSTGQLGADSSNTDKYGITADQTWATEFSYGVVRGKALCSTTNGEWATTGTPDESTGKGQYCWCQIDGFTPTGGSKQSLSGAWVFYNDIANAADCAYNCAHYCANLLQDVGDFRAALLGSVGASPAICEANDITIDWGNGTPTSCKYDGDITTPAQGVEKTGYTFKGWKFNKNN